MTNPYYIILLLCFLALIAILLIRYVNNTVDREFRGLAQAVTDPDFRHAEISRVDALLANHLPLPSDTQPIPKPRTGLRGAAAPVLLALGVILLWGGGAAQRDRETWYYGGLIALALAAAVMLISLRKRQQSRTARLLLFRADLKRLDGDRKNAAEDLRQLLRLTPWDDSAWAELSDDLAADGKLQDALEAAAEAAKIDPDYDEYHMLQASLSIRLGKTEEAKAAIGEWTRVAGVAEDDPRLAVYQAALQLAEGKRDDAEKTLKRILLDHDEAGLEFLDDDQALNEVKELLPGRSKL